MKGGKVISVRLDDEDLSKLSEISKNEGVKRSNIIQRALKNYIQNYGKKQPETGELSLKIEDLERRLNNLTNRVNILTNQIDRLVIEKKPR
jgi:metal-responsive CopG/Arc/MetJ family transcriptional regulator